MAGAGAPGVRWRGWEGPEVGARGYLGWAFQAAPEQRCGAVGGGKLGAEGRAGPSGQGLTGFEQPLPAASGAREQGGESRQEAPQ